MLGVDTVGLHTNVLSPEHTLQYLFWSSLLGEWGGWGFGNLPEVRVLLNILQYTGQPHESNYTAQNINHIM